MEEGNPNSVEIPTIEKPGLVESYQLGSAIRWLGLAPSLSVSATDVASVLERFSNLLSETGWATEIESEANEMASRLRENYGDEDVLAEDEVDRLHQIVNNWEQDIGAELNNKAVINIHNSGLFDVEEAMENPELLFRKEVWEWMPRTPQNDVSEACRTLAARCSTATVFLSLRAVEDRLRHWYKEETKNEISSTWGRVLDELENEYGDGDRPAILSNLDYLREKKK